MANTKSAKKQILITKRNNERNVANRTRLKNALKGARTALAGSDPAGAQEALNRAVAALYKSVNKGIIKKQNASRRVGRLMRAYNKAHAVGAQQEGA
jgi:small subunit ribosomal protein S20